MTTSTVTQLPAGTYTIDPSHTEVSFTVRHAGISRVRGTFSGVAGTLTVGENLLDSAVTATIDPATVDTKDENRDGHLRSPEFFDVEQFPTWTFTSTGIRADGDEHVITGDLTIHGVTQQVELATEFGGTATDPFGNFRAGFSAETQISRKDFGLTWNAALEAGGVLVGDKIRISLEVSAIKQDEQA